MIKLYLKQAWNLLRENKLVSGLSIGGTALSICAVMLVVLIYQVTNGSYAPEVNRYRMMYVTAVQCSSKDGGNVNRSHLSSKTLKECLYPLTVPECVSGVARTQVSLSLPKQRLFNKYQAIYTDDAFWKMFEFRFVDGQPFTSTDFRSGIRNAVISDKTARRLFGSSSVVGKTFLINSVEYKVCGVVEEVSTAALNASSDVWVPYTGVTSLTSNNINIDEGCTGMFDALILARSVGDFDAVRKEVDNKLAAFNASLSNVELSFLHCPYSQLERMAGNDGFNGGDFLSWFKQTGGLILFLLFLPALNIIGISLTQYRKRRTEIGLRKSFGASSFNLLRQVMVENLLISFIGGGVGLALAYLLLLVCKPFLLLTASELTVGMLLKPETFVVAFLFTLLLNLLSAGLPAWRVSRMPIVDALHDAE